jgi:hypothetical protein
MVRRGPVRLPVLLRVRQAGAATLGVVAVGAGLLVWQGDGMSVEYHPDACQVTDGGALVCVSMLA